MVLTGGFFLVVKDNHQTVTAGLAAVASLTLRSPDNCQAFYDAGILDVIVTAMKRHQDQKSVQVCF